MGMGLSPYRVLGERPSAEALRALPVVEVRPPLVLSASATFDDEDFASVRYVSDGISDGEVEVAVGVPGLSAVNPPPTRCEVGLMVVTGAAALAILLFVLTHLRL